MSSIKKLPFLWEIGCEEIPAAWLPKLILEFGEVFRRHLDEARLEHSSVDSYGTLRRLVVHVPKLAEKQENRREKITGPPVAVAKDESGQWTKAATGFAKKNGVEPRRLKILSTDKGDYVGVERLVKGRRTGSLLPELMAAALRDIGFPKFMNWDARLSDDKGAFAFGRPIRWMLTLYGSKLVPFEIKILGATAVRASRRTRGHRFLAPKGRDAGAPFPVSSFRELKQGLKKHYVILDPEERRARVEKELEKLERKAGAERAAGLSSDLVAELVEWPGAILGSYPQEFFSLPEEIRHTVLIHHQKYFPLRGKPAFIAVTNMASDPKGHIRRGSERVVVARLRDAKFFWEEDLARSLDDRRSDLSRVVFHQKLGTYAEKIERMLPLGTWLSGQTGTNDARLRRAIELCKCDLGTGMVGEFPELQGITGGLYAKEQKEPDSVAKAIYSHYLPVGTEDGFPQNPEGVLLALADRMDTVAGMFFAGLVPKGSRDPFGLRRAAIGVVRLLLESGDRCRFPLSLTLNSVIDKSLEGFASKNTVRQARSQLQEFFVERLRYQLGRDYRYDELNAVFALGPLGMPLTDVKSRIDAVAAVRGSEDFKALSIAFKRVKNILADKQPGTVDRRALREKAEVDLYNAFTEAAPKAEAKIEKGAYATALRQLSKLRPQVDRFFDDVLVMAKEPKLRANRLAILSELSSLFTRVADLSELVGDDAETRTSKQ